MSEIRKGVLLLIYNSKNKFLLIQHTKDLKWGFVSGGIENGESEIDAIVREAGEEIGINLSKKQIQALSIVMTFQTPSYTGQYNWYKYKLADTEKINLHNPQEIIDFGWFSKEEVIAKLADKPLLVEHFTKSIILFNATG